MSTDDGVAVLVANWAVFSLMDGPAYAVTSLSGHYLRKGP